MISKSVIAILLLGLYLFDNVSALPKNRLHSRRRGRSQNVRVTPQSEDKPKNEYDMIKEAIKTRRMPKVHTTEPKEFHTKAPHHFQTFPAFGGRKRSFSSYDRDLPSLSVYRGGESPFGNKPALTPERRFFVNHAAGKQQRRSGMPRNINRKSEARIAPKRPEPEYIDY